MEREEKRKDQGTEVNPPKKRGRKKGVTPELNGPGNR